MNTYKIIIKWKNGKDLVINAETDSNPRDTIAGAYVPNGILYLGDYIIPINEILWIKVEGETLEEPIRE